MWERFLIQVFIEVHLFYCYSQIAERLINSIHDLLIGCKDVHRAVAPVAGEALVSLLRHRPHEVQQVDVSVEPVYLQHLSCASWPEQRHEVELLLLNGRFDFIVYLFLLHWYLLDLSNLNLLDLLFYLNLGVFCFNGVSCLNLL